MTGLTNLINFINLDLGLCGIAAGNVDRSHDLVKFTHGQLINQDTN